MILLRKLLSALILAMLICLPFSICMVRAQNEISWVYDYPKGMKMAQAENKPVMIFISEDWCPRCRNMEQTTFMNYDVIRQSANFINIRVIGTQQGVLYNYSTPPLVVFTDPNGTVLIRKGAELSAGDIIGLQNNVLASAPYTSRSATADVSVIPTPSFFNSTSSTKDTGPSASLSSSNSATVEESNAAVPGFETVFAISAFLSVALVMSKYRRRN